MHIIADIGGTKMRIVGTRNMREFSGEPRYIDTPHEYREGCAVLAGAMRDISQGEKIEKVLIGIRGSIARDRASMTDRSVLVDWSRRPLAHDIQDAISAESATLFNDVTLNSIGEAVYGAGTGAPIVVYYTVSTGVNGTRVVDGRVEVASQGFEAGGQYLRVGDTTSSLEEMVSGAAIFAKYGVHPKELGKDSPVWEELARIFAYGLHNSILHWSPDRVVLGGSMFNEIGISVERVAFHVKDIMRNFPDVPEIVHASLGDFGGLWGGLALLNQAD